MQYRTRVHLGDAEPIATSTSFPGARVKCDAAGGTALKARDAAQLFDPEEKKCACCEQGDYCAEHAND